MKHGFIKVAAASPALRVADPSFNTDEIIKTAGEAERAGAKILVFPELSITGYTCHDLFLQDLLLQQAKRELKRIAEYSKNTDMLLFVGLPLQVNGRLYNTAAAVHNGRVLALIPKTFIPNYGEFYEVRHFEAAPSEVEMIPLFDRPVPFGTKILLDIDAVCGLSVAAEICEDMWIPDSPSISHTRAGATLVVNLSASNETVGKDGYRLSLLTGVSARCLTGYIYASAGETESTQDLVFGGRLAVAENGTILAKSRCFDDMDFGKTRLLLADLDIARLLTERRRMNTFRPVQDAYTRIPVHMEVTETRLTRTFDPHPFVPADVRAKEERCEEILNIQSRGLAKRLQHTGLACAVLGISGGLDSTLALLVTARAFDLLQIPRSQILSVTMPGFGTTDRTYTNAIDMARALKTTVKEIDIRASVSRHFEDIGQDPSVHDVTYENSQARERTQILMDLANRANGLVIGTGDLSELALGWATYNGDHMSMYAVNAGVPKTLVSHLVRYFADRETDSTLQRVLYDVLDTPVSPELLPPTGSGTIAQKTEDLVGPYELHDFFLYYMLRQGAGPAKIYRIACRTFEKSYAPGVILKWEKTFFRRFFSQQFKRSCLPDGPKVGTIALSPRGDLRMPSDAGSRLWLRELEELEMEEMEEMLADKTGGERP